MEDIERITEDQQRPVEVREKGPPRKDAPRWEGYLQSFERTLIAYNLETRGIKRVEPEERHDLQKLGFFQIFVLWFSLNLAANNITLGMLGPAIFELSFLDSSLWQPLVLDLETAP